MTGKPRLRTALFEFLFPGTWSNQTYVFFTRWKGHLGSGGTGKVLLRSRGSKPFDDVCEPHITSKAVPRRIKLKLAVIGAAGRLCQKG